MSYPIFSMAAWRPATSVPGCDDGARLLAGEVDDGLIDPVLFGQDAFDAQRTRGTGHALDVEDDAVGVLTHRSGVTGERAGCPYATSYPCPSMAPTMASAGDGVVVEGDVDGAGIDVDLDLVDAVEFGDGAFDRRLAVAAGDVGNGKGRRWSCGQLLVLGSGDSGGVSQGLHQFVDDLAGAAFLDGVHHAGLDVVLQQNPVHLLQ